MKELGQFQVNFRSTSGQIEAAASYVARFILQIKPALGATQAILAATI